MSTITTPPRDSSLSNRPETTAPESLTRAYSSSVASTLAESSPSSSQIFPTAPVEAPPTPPPSSFVETLLTLLQALQTTIWMYILHMESWARQYIEEHYSQKESQAVGEKDEKVSMRKDSIPQITGRSRTGTNVRDLAMVGASSVGRERKGSIAQSSSSSENESRRRPNSAKGTGFEEPFCKFRNTTLPHPSADLSPNASISAPEDIAESKVHRHRRHIPGRRSSNKNVLHGKILPNDMGYSTGGKLGSIASNESAMSSTLSGLYDDIVYEDGSSHMELLAKTNTGFSGSMLSPLTKSRTAFSGTNSSTSTIRESVNAVQKPDVKVTIPKFKVTKPPLDPIEVVNPRFSMTDWEGETSKALESIMSPLTSHPVMMKPSDSSPIDRTDSMKSMNMATIPILREAREQINNDRPSTASSSPIIKPGGFRRVSAASPNHGKKDSGISMARFELGSRDSNKSLEGQLDDGDGDADADSFMTTPSRKKGKGLLRKLKLQK